MKTPPLTSSILDESNGRGGRACFQALRAHDVRRVGWTATVRWQVGNPTSTQKALVPVLIDSGAELNLLTPEVAARLNLKIEVPRDRNIVGMGVAKCLGDTTALITTDTREYKRMEFSIVDIDHHAVILGIPAIHQMSLVLGTDGSGNMMIPEGTTLKNDITVLRLLPTVEVAMNTAMNESIGVSPHEAETGERFRLPMDVVLPDRDHDQPGPLKLRFEQIQEIKARIWAAQQQQKKHADARRQDVCLEVGQWVLLSTKELTGLKKHKLSAKRIGPFEITQKLRPTCTS